MKERFLVAHAEEVRIFSKRLQFFNRELTFFTAGLALGAACSDSPRFFGCMSALMVLLVGCHANKPYERLFKLWREERHPFLRVRIVWRSYLPFTVAWLALGAVAIGFIGKSGFAWLS